MAIIDVKPLVVKQADDCLVVIKASAEALVAKKSLLVESQNLLALQCRESEAAHASLVAEKAAVVASQEALTLAISSPLVSHKVALIKEVSVANVKLNELVEAAELTQQSLAAKLETAQRLAKILTEVVAQIEQSGGALNTTKSAVDAVLDAFGSLAKTISEFLEKHTTCTWHEQQQCLIAARAELNKQRAVIDSVQADLAMPTVIAEVNALTSSVASLCAELSELVSVGARQQELVRTQRKSVDDICLKLISEAKLQQEFIDFIIAQQQRLAQHDSAHQFSCPCVGFFAVSVTQLFDPIFSGNFALLVDRVNALQDSILACLLRYEEEYVKSYQCKGWALIPRDADNPIFARLLSANPKYAQFFELYKDILSFSKTTILNEAAIVAFERRYARISAMERNTFVWLLRAFGVNHSTASERSCLVR